jgi:hypothetical protein
MGSERNELRGSVVDCASPLAICGAAVDRMRCVLPVGTRPEEKRWWAAAVHDAAAQPQAPSGSGEQTA